jgi:signal transduction histidine kinase
MRRPLKDRRRPLGPVPRRRGAGCALLQDPAGTEGLFSVGLRRPLRIVLERLDRHSSGIRRAWRTLLRRLNPSRDEYDKLAKLDLAACYRHLLLGGPTGGSKGDAAYCLAVDRSARGLMRASVAEEQVIAAMGLYLESCLGHAKRPSEIKALVQLTSLTQRLIAFGYGEERATGLTRLDDRERQKLSGDLHDEVGADLVVLKLYVEMIALELAKGSVALVGPKLQEALVLIAHAIESVRRLTLDLGPASLESLGFLPALRSVVRQFSKRTGIKVELREAETAVSLPASHETALYRVLLGALSNVAKHSKARRATVTLRNAGNVFAMAVEDDGEGFDASVQSPARSFGLTAMSERVRGLHGRLHIESHVASRRGEKSGTRIEVRLPLRKAVAP